MFSKKKEVIKPQQQITIDLPYAIGSQFYDKETNSIMILKQATLSYDTKTKKSKITYVKGNDKNTRESLNTAEDITVFLESKSWVTVDEYRNNKAEDLCNSILFGSQVNLVHSNIATTLLILKKGINGSVVFYNTNEEKMHTFSKQEFLTYLKAADSYEEV